MDTPLYDRACNNTQRAMRKHKKRWGNQYNYQPRRQIIQRWMKELNWTEKEVKEQLKKERAYLLKEYRGVNGPF